MQKKFELLEHTGDIKLRVFGTTQQELFANAVYAMFESIQPHKVGNIRAERSIDVNGISLEILLVNFLSECLYLSDTHNEAYDTAHFDQLTEKHIHGTIFGYPIDGFERVEIKAVTYHDLKIEVIDGLWQATIVFDI